MEIETPQAEQVEAKQDEVVQEEPQLETVKPENDWRAKREKAIDDFINSRMSKDIVEPKKEEDPLLSKEKEGKAEEKPVEKVETVEKENAINSAMLANIARERQRIEKERAAFEQERQQHARMLEEYRELKQVHELIKQDPASVLKKYRSRHREHSSKRT